MKEVKNMKKMEVRFLPVSFSEASGDSLEIQGYVNLTEEYSEVLLTNRGHKFVEKISKGAFGRAIQRAKEIDFLAEHDEKMILASTRNNSLNLVEDDKGLFMSARISPTTWGKDYYTLVKDGIIQNFSFGFVAVNDDWEERADGILERTINELDLYEVSLVKNPAYPQSYAEARSIMTLDETLKRGEDMSKEKVDLEKVEKSEDISEIISQEMEKHFNRILEEIKDRQKEDEQTKEKLKDEEKDKNIEEDKDGEEKKEEDVKEDKENEERNIDGESGESEEESDDEKTLKSTILGLEMKVEKIQSMLEEFLNDKAREEKEDEQTDETEEEKQKQKEEEKAEKEGGKDSPNNLKKLQETLANLKEYD